MISDPCLYGVHFSSRSISLEVKYILGIALKTFTQPVNYHATEVLTFQPGHLKETGLIQIENYNFLQTSVNFAHFSTKYCSLLFVFLDIIADDSLFPQ